MLMVLSLLFNIVVIYNGLLAQQSYLEHFLHCVIVFHRYDYYNTIVKKKKKTYSPSSVWINVRSWYEKRSWVFQVKRKFRKKRTFAKHFSNSHYHNIIICEHIFAKTSEGNKTSLKRKGPFVRERKKAKTQLIPAPLKSPAMKRDSIDFAVRIEV